jgi:ribonuclease HII
LRQFLVQARGDALYARGALEPVYRIGVDENGLGARLGPLVVTAVAARMREGSEQVLRRRLPKRVRADLADSKELVSHSEWALGEAWARALAPSDITTPEALFDYLSQDGASVLKQPCPDHVLSQCWRAEAEPFHSAQDDVERLRGHCRFLAERGVQLLAVKSRVVCTKKLNEARQRGHNRFVSDLHAMEELILGFRRELGQDVHAVCGKVGGMGAYGKFFGPLAGWLHVTLEEGRGRSAYRFPGVGDVHFVRDADASDPLVMLASLVGKYVRELLMRRIARHYAELLEADVLPSGYHDPVTHRFVQRTALVRQHRGVPDTCFEREREPHA